MCLSVLHRRRKMSKVRGGQRHDRARKILTTPTFHSNHAHFCNNEAFVTGRQAVEQAVSQADLKLFILEDLCDDS